MSGLARGTPEMGPTRGVPGRRGMAFRNGNIPIGRFPCLGNVPRKGASAPFPLTGPKSRILSRIVKTRTGMDTVFIYDFSNVLLCAEGIHREERAKIDSAKLREARTALRSDGSYVRYFESVREAIRGKYPNARTASHVLVMPRSTSSDFYSSVAKDLNRKGFVVFSHAKANLDDEIMEFARKSPRGGISIVSNDWDFQGSW